MESDNLPLNSEISSVILYIWVSLNFSLDLWMIMH